VLLKCFRSPQLPPATLEDKPPFIASLLLFCSHTEMGAVITAPGQLEVNLFLSGRRGGKSLFGIILVSAVSRICLEILSSQPLA